MSMKVVKNFSRSNKVRHDACHKAWETTVPSFSLTFFQLICEITIDSNRFHVWPKPSSLQGLTLVANRLESNYVIQCNELLVWH